MFSDIKLFKKLSFSITTDQPENVNLSVGI